MRNLCPNSISKRPERTAKGRPDSGAGGNQRPTGKLDAEGRVARALDNLPGEYVLSSSFGIQAAVSLHLVNQIRPDIPVILTDTGYLFPETYRFIDELTDKLKLNLKCIVLKRRGRKHATANCGSRALKALKVQ